MFGFGAHKRYQFAGILGGNTEFCMHHRSEPRLGHEPFTAKTLRKVNGFLRAEVHAHTAPFTGNRVDGKRIDIVGNCVEAADILTDAATNAVALTDHRFMTA